MGNVIGFDRAKAGEDRTECHVSGQVTCTACKHEWVAVAPAGTKLFECPECRRDFGLLKHPVEPDWKWKCHCGEMLHWLTSEGAMCRGCGAIASDW